MITKLLKAALLQDIDGIRRLVSCGERDERAFIQPGDVKSWGRNPEFTYSLSNKEKHALMLHVDIAYYNNLNILAIHEALILSGHPFPCGASHKNLLYIAATEFDQNNAERVPNLIRKAIDSNVYEDEFIGSEKNVLLGKTVQAAASNGHLKVIEYLSRLLPQGAEEATKKLIVEGGTHAVALAAFAGHRDCLNFLLTILPEEDWIKTAVNEPFPDRKNLLQDTSAYHKGWEVVDILLERGCSPNFFERTAYGVMPFISKIISQEKTNDILLLAIQKGADINCSDQNGLTPIHWACRMDNVEAFIILLQAGSIIQVVDKKGCTPMRYAGARIMHFYRSNLEMKQLHRRTPKAPHQTTVRRL